MGGYGSGRQGGQATVEGCRTLRLDVNRVTRGVRERMCGLSDGERLHTGPSVWSWTAHGDTEPWAKVFVSLEMDRWRGEAKLVFNVDHWSRRTGPQVQTVLMETTPCRFGGQRWWWICPATGRRCATLYLPNGGTLFLSRGPGAYGLKYASQNGTALDRSHGRIARLHRKMGGQYQHIDDPPPRRPKGMRQRTYERLVAELEAEQERHDYIWMAGALPLLRRLGGLP